MSFSRALAAASLMLGCGCSPIAVYVERDAGPSLSGLASYGWAAARRTEEGDPRVDPDLDAVVREAVEAELAARGFRKRAEAPDFLVGYHVAITDALQSWSMDEYYGYQRTSYNFYAGRSATFPKGTGRQRALVYEVRQGALVLDISLPRTQRLLWRAHARAIFDSDLDRETRDRRIRDAVKRMLEKLPR